MKKAIDIIICLTISTLCFGQSVIEMPANPADSITKLYTTVDQEAMFPGGPDAWRKYLQKNLKINLPVKNGVPDGKYQVMAKFIVSIDGTIADIHCITKFGFGMEEEVIRIIKKSPNWEPALRYGRKVNSIKTLPVTFFYSTN